VLVINRSTMKSKMGGSLCWIRQIRDFTTKLWVGSFAPT